MHASSRFPSVICWHDPLHMASHGHPSRRKFLIVTAIGGVIAALALAPKGRLRLLVPARLPDVSSQSALTTATLFIGALFAHELTSEDSADLLQRLRETIELESARARDYQVLAQYLDQAAHSSGADSFAAATAALRNHILGELMRVNPGTHFAHLLSRLSAGRREYYRMRASTVPALAWLYRRSSIPWRARGYRRPPGVPDDWRDYLTAGSRQS
ncbi:MAG TPA: hypothetical protein VNZ06_01345 [Steroidobacteraceae bacterium]|jgi:hypothetical protein|nr:hypothetical protein [Steroidobacteraceae bacterium]